MDSQLEDKIAEFVKERDAALRSMDLDTLLSFCLAYEINIPDDKNVFLAGMHKARLGIIAFSETEKEVSRQWLLANGFDLEPGGKL